MATTSGPAQPALPSQRRPTDFSPTASSAAMQRVKDILFRWLCRSTALLVIAVMLLLVGTMVREAWPAITELGARFLIVTEWNPSEDRIGALPFIYGTLVTSMIAMALAVPFGVGTAAFL